MALDPNIALGVRGIEVPNPVAQYAQMAQLQNMQTQNQLHQMQMREAEATSQERNALRQLNPNAPDYEAQLFRLNPQLGISYRKEAATTAAQRAAEARSLTEAAAAKQKMLGQAWRDISGRPSDANITAHLEDIADSPLYDAAEKAAITKRATSLLAMPFAERQMYLAQQGASASELKPSVQTINRSGATDVLRVPAFNGAPVNIGSYEDVPLPLPVQNQKIQIARESRPPVQPVAPTIAQIVDPSDPNKMITVDARRYQGGGAGSPGVIGVSGKEPSAALRENKTEAGKTQLQNIIEDVRAHYDQLNQAGDIPSTERGALSNIVSSTQSSALGQFGGRVIGTESQRARENIKSSRLMLLNALKQATGKSAQELNSNVELKTNLDALSDPTQGYEAAIDILNKLEDVYVRGVAPAKARAATPKTAPAATKSGASVSNW
jgi:hypothetical protein